MAHKLYMQHR